MTEIIWASYGLDDDALIYRLGDWSPYHGEQLAVVDLSGNSLSGRGVRALLRHLQANGASVSKLKLHRNQLDDSAAKALANYLKNQSWQQPVLEMHLSNNQITREGGATILQAAHDCQCYPLSGKTVQMGGHGRRSLWLRLENNAIEDPEGMIYDASMRGGVLVHIDRGWHSWRLQKALAGEDQAEVHMHFSVLGDGKGEAGGKGQGKDEGKKKGFANTWNAYPNNKWGETIKKWGEAIDSYSNNSYNDYQYKQPSASAMSAPYIGSKISVISNSGIRYEGIGYSIDTKDSTISLRSVYSFGTEGRKWPEIPPSNEMFKFITFQGHELQDVSVLEGSKESGGKGGTGGNSGKNSWNSWKDSPKGYEDWKDWKKPAWNSGAWQDSSKGYEDRKAAKGSTSLQKREGKDSQKGAQGDSGYEDRKAAKGATSFKKGTGRDSDEGNGKGDKGKETKEKKEKKEKKETKETKEGNGKWVTKEAKETKEGKWVAKESKEGSKGDSDGNDKGGKKWVVKTEGNDGNDKKPSSPASAGGKKWVVKAEGS